MPTSFTDFITQSLRTLPPIAIVAGLLLVFFGGQMKFSSWALSYGSAEKSITVVDMESRYSKGVPVYRPIFEMESVDEGRVRYKGTTWISPKPHEPGDIVIGFYDPITGEIASKAMLDHISRMGTSTILSGCLVLLFAGLYFWRGWIAKSLP